MTTAGPARDDVAVDVRRRPQRAALVGQAMVFVLLVIAAAANAALQPTFFTAYNLSSMFATFAPSVAAAVAQTIVVLTGAIDLSLGALITLASVVAVVLVDGDPSKIPLAVAAALAVGLLGGLFNGLLVALVRLQPIVATFATTFVFGGLALTVLPQPGGSVPVEVTTAYRAATLGVPNALWLILLVALLWVALRRSRLGIHLYAVGGNTTAAFATGVRVTRVQVAAYLVAGLFAGVAALAILANTGSGDPYVGSVGGAAIIGGELTLSSIAALVIGGTALSGGRGGALGSIAGAIVLGLVANIVFFLGVSSGMRELIDGLIVIGALAFTGAPWLRRGRQ